MSAYEPGTVAVATVRGVKDVRVIKSCDPLAPVHCWFSAESVNNSFGHTVNDVIDVRPLVVLDLGASPPKHSVASVLRAINHPVTHWLADQIEAQTRPPKPAEPTGLGAVVKDRDGRLWVRFATDPVWGQPWCRTDEHDRRYKEIDAVEVVAEGVAT